MPAQQIYLFVLLGIIHVGSALWVYKDAKLRGQSLYWALGTALMPEAFFPIYFWRIEPKLIWFCPACTSANTDSTRRCRHCERLYTREETVLRLHGNPEPSDVMVISLAALLVHRLCLYIIFLIRDGSDLLTEVVDITTLSPSQLWTIELIVANALIWLCFHCVTARYLGRLNSIGLQFTFSYRQIALPLVLAPLLFLFSESTVHVILQVSRWTSFATLENLVQWERDQESAYLPEDFDASIILIAFVSVVLSPIAYEVFYRGIGYSAFARRFGYSAGIILSALFYAIFHGGVIQFIPSFVFGVVVALLFHRTRSLIPSIITHSLVNAIALAARIYNA